MYQKPYMAINNNVSKVCSITVSFSQVSVDPMLLPPGNPFKCHEEVLYLQPMIPPFGIFSPEWGMLRRSRCVQKSDTSFSLQMSLFPFFFFFFLYHVRFLFVWRVRRTFFPSGWCFFYLVTTDWIFDISYNM